MVLELKAVDEKNLKCALFYNRSSTKLFVWKFPSGSQNQTEPIYLDSWLTQTSSGIQQNISNLNFKLSSSCDRILMNNQRLFTYNRQYTFYKDKYTPGSYNESFWWNQVVDFSSTSTIISGHDEQFNIGIVNGDLYKLDVQLRVDSYEGDKAIGEYHEAGYVQTIYIYMMTLEVVGFNLQIKHKLIDTSVAGDLSTFDERIIVFGYKQVTNGYNYTLQAIHSTEDQINMFSQDDGFSKTKPTFIYSDNLKRAIVYGNTSTGTPFYKGFYYDYDAQNAIQLDFPTSITKTNWYLQISDYFLYARTTFSVNGKYNQSAYIFANQKLYAYFEEVPIQQSSYNNNWQYSFIKPLDSTTKIFFMKAQMTVYHVYESVDRVYYRVQAIDSFEKNDFQKYYSFSDLAYGINAGSNKDNFIVNAKVGFRWIYAVQDPPVAGQSITTTVFILNYDRQNNRQLNLTGIRFQDKKQFFVMPYMVNRQIDCFYVVNDRNDTKALQFLATNGTSIDYIGSIQDQAFQVAFPISDKEIKFSSRCQIVTIFDRIYFLDINSGPPTYQIQNISPLNLNTTQFDQNFIFAIEGLNLYKLNGSTYVKIFTYDFKQQNEIVSSTDQTKVIIKTYEYVTEEKTNPTTQRTTTLKYIMFEMVNLYLLNGTWTQIKPQTKLTDVKITNFLSSLQLSKSFERCLLCYILNTTASQKICLLSFVNYTSIQAYQSVYNFGKDRVPKIFNVKDRLIYINDAYELTRDQKTVSYDCYQNLFGVWNNSIFLFYRYAVECKLFDDAFVKREVVQSQTNQSYYFLIELLNKTLTVILNTTPISAKTVQSYPEMHQLNRGFFYQNSSYYECEPGCLRCENYYFCTKCMSGYTLNMDINKCVKCNGYCDVCNSTNLTTCFTCPLGFYYNKTLTTCSPCNSICQTCSGKSPDKCTSCRIGYFLNNNIEKKKRKTCLSCPLNCDYCQNSIICTSCRFGYSILSNGSCIKCPQDCSQCDPNKISNCIGCRNGFQLVTIDGKSSCQKCPDLCLQCYAGKCTKCRDDCKLNIENNICSKICWAPCQQCSLTDPRSCTSCILGYTLNGTACLPDLSCSANSTCKSCPSGYTLISNKCYQCAIGTNCAECDSIDPTVCTACKQGFFLQGQDCIPCDAGICLRCYASIMCQECKTGYFLSQMNSTASLCIKCSNHCTSCIESVTNCLSCEEGYNLTGTSCVPMQSVNFTLKLSTDFGDFTYDIYTQLIQEVANLVVKTTSEIRIFSLRNGSVTVYGNIESKSTADETKILSSLSSGLAAGTKVAGQNILASQFVGYTPITATPTESKSNLVIILATVIPGSLSNYSNNFSRFGFNSSHNL